MYITVYKSYGNYAFELNEDGNLKPMGRQDAGSNFTLFDFDGIDEQFLKIQGFDSDSYTVELFDITIVKETGDGYRVKVAEKTITF